MYRRSVFRSSGSSRNGRMYDSRDFNTSSFKRLDLSSTVRKTERKILGHNMGGGTDEEWTDDEGTGEERMKVDLTALCSKCADLEWEDLEIYHPPYIINITPPKTHDMGSISEIRDKASTCASCSFVLAALNIRHAKLLGTDDSNSRSRICHVSIRQSRNSQYETKGRGGAVVGGGGLNLARVYIYLALADGNIEGLEILQVKAEQATIVEDSIDHPVTDVPFSGRVRPLLADFQLFRKWLEECESEKSELVDGSEDIGHLRCALKARAGVLPCPLKLIDIKKKCLIMMDEEQRQQPRYVALSYVWGKIKGLRLDHTTATEIYEEGYLTVERVGATVSDAMSAAASMGEEYLWVDRLCIRQDDKTDMDLMLPIMDMIYGHSVFTIVAAAGEDMNYGLPGVRAGTRHFEQVILGMQHLVFLSVISPSEHYSDYIKGTQWSTRGWTFQEGQMAGRRLVFTEEQVYWSCEPFFRCEETVLERQSSFLPFGSSDDLISPPGDPTSDRMAVWQEKQTRFFVDGYTKRSLSFDSDRLNAFKGILRSISSVTQEEFFAGLPSSYFGEKLCWEGLGTLSNDFVPSYPFPSWSWLAWKGCKIGFKFCNKNFISVGIAYYRKKGDELVLIESQGSSHRRRNYEMEWSPWERVLKSTHWKDERWREVHFPDLQQIGHCGDEKDFNDFDGCQDIRSNPCIYFWTDSAIVNIESFLDTSPLMAWTAHCSEGIDIRFSYESVASQLFQGKCELIVIADGRLYGDKFSGFPEDDRFILMVIDWENNTARRRGLASVKITDWDTIMSCWKLIALA